MKINQQPQHQSTTDLDSNIISQNLKKRALVAGKKVALSRMKSSHATDEMDVTQ